MRKFLKDYIIYPLFLVLFLQNFFVYAQDASVTITPSDEAGAINVRSGPGTEYTIRFSIDSGQTLEATGRNSYDANFICQNNPINDNHAWIRTLTSETIEGWVNLCAIDIIGDINTLPVVEPAYANLIADTEPLEILVRDDSDFDNPEQVATTRGSATVRTEPWLGSPPLGNIPVDTRIEVIKMTPQAGWVQIQYGDVTGWIPGFSVRLSETQKSIIPVISIHEAMPSLQVFNTEESDSSSESDASSSVDGLGGWCTFGGFTYIYNPILNTWDPVINHTLYYGLC